MNREIYLVANGDLRLTANQQCEAAQQAMEAQIIDAFTQEGFKVKRAHGFDPVKKHSFIDSQRHGIEVFKNVPKKARLIVAEAVWQYSQHVLPGLIAHEGPILTIANWSGTWPGLVGLLNLNASLTKAGVKYSTLWSQDFTDEFFLKGIREWLRTSKVRHNTSHLHSYKAGSTPEEKLGDKIARDLIENQAILGVFDEGCMGMYNAIIPDELLHPMGIHKERLSQSTLYAKMLTIPDEAARKVYDWCLKKGLQFKLGGNDATDLTEKQVLTQCKMYIASLQLADEFGCDSIGIQYQQGLKDLTPASDLVEGLLNNVDRPPAYDSEGKRELFAGEAMPHFNEVDECAGVDALVTNRIWKKLGLAPETTLHDLRWGRDYSGNGVDDFVWVLLISGGAPAAHFIDGYRGASSERQPPVYFRLGGGTLKGISKPGWIVWSRVFIENEKLCFDTGIGEVVELPEMETEERWKLTTSQWPIMHLVLKGITRDQMMGRHKSNHIQVAYGTGRSSAVKAMKAKAAAMARLGMKVTLCGDVEAKERPAKKFPGQPRELARR
jgi:hypothetical protein